MIRQVTCALALALAAPQTARAADQPLYQPQPGWVKPVAIPLGAKPTGAAADTLLWTMQERLAAGDDEAFVEQAVRIDAPAGLQEADKLTLSWDPATQSLAIHRARLLRAGRVIDLLAGGARFAVLRRETNLEAAMIDGQLTATLQPEGVQVGDVVDFAYTLTSREPALAGHSEGMAYAAHQGSVGRLYLRTLWPAGKPFQTWKTDDLPAFRPVAEPGWAGVEIDQTAAVSPDPPKGAFSYDRLFGLTQASDFHDWAEVSATAYPLYAKASTLKAGSPLAAEIARIRAAHPDAKGRALDALETVENQTRYFYVGLNAGGYTPAAADLTWTRRFGDCKGKTVLLLALLNGLGLSAEPALVNTAGGDGLDRELPVLGAFDHVLAHLVIDGRDYWLDATRVGDEDLDVLPTPADHWALPVRAQGAGLIALKPRDPVLPTMDGLFRLDLRRGVAEPARVHEELTYREEVGWSVGMTLRRASPVDRDKALRRMIAEQYSWIAPDKLAFTYDPKRMEARIVVDGTGKAPFTASGDGAGDPRDWLVDSSYLASSVDLTRTTDYHRQAPYAVAYPLYTRMLVQAELPDGGKGFEVLNEGAVNQTVAGVSYSRTAAMQGGRFVMAASSRAVAESFPAAEAERDEPLLRQLSEYPISLRYTPPKALLGEAADPPGPAAALKRGEAAYTRKDYDEADRAFSQAIAAAPDARVYYDRAAVRAALGHRQAARDDLQAALKIEPKHALSLFALGRLDLAAGDLKSAANRFSSAVENSGYKGTMIWRVATAYEGSGRFAEAAPFYDWVMKIEPAPAARDVLLNQSCWTRAQWGRELDAALSACDEALRLRPGEPSYLDSRGLVELRSGALAKSVADYDLALARRPDLPTSLYGRGLAEAKLGRDAAATTDLAAARRVDPKVDATFAAWGLAR